MSVSSLPALRMWGLDGPVEGPAGTVTKLQITALSRTLLEGATVEGESPVGEKCCDLAWDPGVPRDTRNPVGSRGDHPPRLNTSDDR